MRLKKASVKNMTYVSVCTALLAVSAWLTVPFTVNFTMQTFAVFFISLAFTIRQSVTAILLYIALGFTGVPVFSGFGSGIAVIFGPTGGYMLAFIFIPPIIHGILRLFKVCKHKKVAIWASMLVGILFCYCFGTIWYAVVCGLGASTDIFAILGICVLPFVVPDILKMGLALFVASRLSPYIKLNDFFGGYYG